MFNNIKVAISLSVALLIISGCETNNVQPIDTTHINKDLTFDNVDYGTPTPPLTISTPVSSLDVLTGFVGDKIGKDSTSIVAWASNYFNIYYGVGVSANFKTPDKALGKADGTSYEIVSLGRSGTIILTFEKAIKNGAGYDFAIFENGISDTFLELAYVEVSSNGIDAVRFYTVSETKNPVGAFGNINASKINGFAGRYKQGYGNCFDLDDLIGRENVTNSSVDLNNINYIRIVDVIGDGSESDSNGHSIYDPYPTTGSAGFDLDAVGVINQVD